MAPSAPPAEKAPLLAEAGFLCLLLLLFVTLHPFMPPAVLTSPVFSAVEPVASDALRQISFTGVFLMIFLAALCAGPSKMVQAVPVSVAVLLGWCLLSATWSEASAVVFRRAALITEVTGSVLLGCALLGPEKAFSRLRLVLLIVLVVNWISIPLIPAAVHLPGELDPKLVGNWRGLYGQKNIAGAVCALTVLTYLFPGSRQRAWTDWAVIAAAAVFLFMTKSKTSMVLLPVAAAFGLLYHRGWKNPLDRAMLAVVGLMALGGFAVFLMANTDVVSQIMQDPDAFTGRTEIWQADLAYLKDHFLLGAGFEGVFETGGQSVLLKYLHGRNWVADVSNSHNGYLDIFLGLGAIGFVLAVTAFVVAPFARFWPLNADRATAGYFAIFAFVIFHNFTEADFLAPDGTVWLAFLMVLNAIRRPSRQPAIAVAAFAPARAFPQLSRAHS